MSHSQLPQILRAMRVTLHVAFAVMLGVGVVRFIVTFDQHPAVLIMILILTLMLAGLYLVGTVAEMQHSKHPERFNPIPLRSWWLAAILILWAGLMLSSMSFAWVSFPLFFIVLHAYRPYVAAPVIMVMLFTILASSYRHGVFNTGYLLGPTIGACVATVVSILYQELRKEAEAMGNAYEKLQRAQTQISLSQHRAGRLAEREKLAADVHDTLSQGFTSILLLSRSLEPHVDTSGRETLHLIEDTAQNNLQQAREFLHGSPLGASDLHPTLRAECHAVERASAAVGAEIDCTFEATGEPYPLTPEVEQTLIRATQSLLSNVSFHSRCTRAKVTLAYWNSHVSLDVVDNGVGFAGAYGYGLRALTERVASVRGQLTVETAVGEGCSVHIVIPVEKT
ncbi:histidine kinase [Brevibacterium sp. UMB1308A]|uniref:sensor histidine kinase n=1 Tax=Brevibacterium sp. UMB1308A TaxID=3050608 RepID=UPI00254C0FB7|nr:histidine kinase [Brevibacterium sp. UMB1308A]MDK8345917.1 histidine kinase [Brevibacterium sp. UMB1308B]MDK8712983.1 histidine kinase [Brevibacterium sp. UMB1308A]